MLRIYRQHFGNKFFSLLTDFGFIDLVQKFISFLRELLLSVLFILIYERISFMKQFIQHHS